MAHQLKALVLAEDQDWVPNTHLAASNHLKFQF